MDQEQGKTLLTIDCPENVELIAMGARCTKTLETSPPSDLNPG